MAEITVKGGTLPQEEINAYMRQIREKNPSRTVESAVIEVDGEYVNVSYKLELVSFERVRRITGYLVGTTDRWNNAKRAEERDRVKHQI